MAQKHPCVVLHIGHIEGTPHSLQMLTVRSLRNSLKELSTVATERGVGSRKRAAAVVKGKSCATMIDKQLQRVMIRSVVSLLYMNCACVQVYIAIGSEMPAQGGGVGGRSSAPHCSGPTTIQPILPHALELILPLCKW